MCVCVYTYIHTYLHTYIHTQTHTHYLHLTAALGSLRVLERKDKVMLGGYEVHKGTDVNVQFYPMFRIGIENPDAFDPDR
jgi:hypothetical protein